MHTDDYYTRKAKELVALGVDAIFLKDASGLLRPERIATLVPTVKQAIGKMPLQIHTHCNSGLAPYVVLQAVDHGVEVVHTATSTLANGVSHSPTELVARNLRRRGYDVPVDLASIGEAAELLAYIAEREDKPVGEPREYDEFLYHHQCPGGMVSNLQYQLQTMGLEDRLEDILEEAGHVRADLGYPIVVSPFAQYIVTQSILNVMGQDAGKQRYDSVPDEVRLYVRGGYGEVAGRIDPNLYDKITRGAEPITKRHGELVEPALDRLRKTRGPFASDDDLLLAAFYQDNEYKVLKAAGPIKTDYPICSTPLATLVREIANRPDITAFHFTHTPAKAAKRGASGR
ncbi:MAG: hypothetical protein HC850_00620 [Rhodomicrobium sp.]|nr:hypothetical protein [Rhodomicrobium sp.]